MQNVLAGQHHYLFICESQRKMVNLKFGQGKNILGYNIYDDKLQKYFTLKH